jgi:hypothetical protein
MNNFRRPLLAGLLLASSLCAMPAEPADDLVTPEPVPTVAVQLNTNLSQDIDKSFETERALAVRAVAGTEPQHCFSSGSPAGSADDPLGRTFLKFCVTNHGNLSYFESPAGTVHLTTREGYVLCNDTDHAFPALSDSMPD